MTKEIEELLRFLDGRSITFLLPKDMQAAEQAHEKGWVALNGNAAMITPEGRAALASVKETP